MLKNNGINLANNIVILKPLTAYHSYNVQMFKCFNCMLAYVRDVVTAPNDAPTHQVVSFWWRWLFWHMFGNDELNFDDFIKSYGKTHRNRIWVSDQIHRKKKILWTDDANAKCNTHQSFFLVRGHFNPRNNIWAFFMIFHTLEYPDPLIRWTTIWLPISVDICGWMLRINEIINQNVQRRFDELATMQNRFVNCALLAGDKERIRRINDNWNSHMTINVVIVCQVDDISQSLVSLHSMQFISREIVWGSLFILLDFRLLLVHHGHSDAHTHNEHFHQFHHTHGWHSSHIRYVYLLPFVIFSYDWRQTHVSRDNEWLFIIFAWVVMLNATRFLNNNKSRIHLMLGMARNMLMTYHIHRILM